MKSEIKLMTVSGMVQYAENESALLAEYNRHGRTHEIRNGVNGRELWHKGHNRMVGIIQASDRAS